MAAPPLVVLDGLEEEAVGLADDAAKGSDGGECVGEQLFGDRDDAVLGGERSETLEPVLHRL